MKQKIEENGTNLTPAGYTLGCVFTLAIGIPTGAWASTLLWGWFVVPLGAPAISMAHAYGLHLAARALLGYPPRNSVDTRNRFEQLVDMIAYGVAVPLVFLGMGAAVHFSGLG